jgi:4-amino-4-deoxychorismate lyase
MTLVNGKPSNQLDISDRAIAYGDGCFTTIAKVAGTIQLLDCHIERLKNGCLALDIRFDDWNSLEQQILEISAPIKNTVIKVIISRGVGGRGYSTLGAEHPNSILSLHDLPTHYDRWQDQGIRLGLSEVKLAKQELWQGTKTLNRLEQILVKQNSNDAVDDELICDTDDMIIETSAANIFWRVENQWFTADLVESGVVGVMRNHVMNALANNSIKVQVVRAHYSMLAYASDVFICNSLMNVIPVREIVFDSQQVQTINNESFSHIAGFINASLNGDG